MSVRWPLLVRRTHKWLALLLGLQVVIWTATGCYMVVVHIDIIHGDHLVRTPQAHLFDIEQLVPPARIVQAHPLAQEVRLARLFDKPVWRVEAASGTFLVDARNGRTLPALSEAQARAVATSIYTGEPNIVSTKLLRTAPLEMQTRPPPYWQVEFAGWNRPTLYISPSTGELVSRRHALWRIFDFAWMLHIMDYDDRSNVNNPLLRVATWSAVFMALSGAWLLLWSFSRGKKKKA